jgi:TorA maturation chaperone TorD
MKTSRLKEMAEIATGRSNIYGLLATLFREELTPDHLRQLKTSGFIEALSEQGEGLGEDFFGRSEGELIEDLAVEYTRLFIGPGRHISPHESVHHERDDGDWGRLWGADTVEVKKFIESAGLQYRPEYSGLPDHISVELEFMHEVTKREAKAWEEEKREDALYLLKMEKKFMDRHLIKWIPSFCDKVISEAELSFYREVARLTRNFIELDKEEIDKYLVEATFSLS